MAFWRGVGNFCKGVGEGFADMGEGVGAGFAAAGTTIAAGAVAVTGDTDTAASLMHKSGEFGKTFIDKAPVVSDVTHTVEGIKEGDWGKAAMGIGGLALTVGTGGAAGTLAKTGGKVLLKTAAKEAEEQAMKQAAKQAEKQLLKQAAKKAEEQAAKQAAKKAEELALKQAAKKAEEQAAKQAAKKAEEQAAKQAAKKAEELAAKEAAEAAEKEAAKQAAKQMAEDMAQLAAVKIAEEESKEEIKEWEEKVKNEMEGFDRDLLSLYAKIAEVNSLISQSARMAFAVRQMNVIFRRPGCALVLIAKQVAVHSESKGLMMKMKLPESSFNLQVAELGLQSFMMVTMIMNLQSFSQNLKGCKALKAMRRAAFVAQLAIISQQTKERTDALRKQQDEIKDIRQDIKDHARKLQYTIDEIKESYRHLVTRLNELFPHRNLTSEDLNVLKEQIEIITNEIMKFEVEFSRARALISAFKADKDVYVDYDSVKERLSPHSCELDVYFAAMCGQWFHDIKSQPKWEKDESIWTEISHFFSSQNLKISEHPEISAHNLKMFYKKWLKIYHRKTKMK